jgi:ribose 5-phosphate isomerase B
MIVHLATDHAGFEHKESLKDYLLTHDYEVVDHGANKLNDTDDYPDFITPCAQAISISENDKAVIFGGSGQGEAMCANRVPNVRAVVYYGGTKDILTISRGAQQCQHTFYWCKICYNRRSSRNS